MISLAAEGGYQIFKLTGADWFWLVFSLVTALLAIGAGLVLVRGVLAADRGTPTMIEIATAIQEGAMAYLRRQFRTIIVILVPVGAIVFFTSTAIAAPGVHSAFPSYAPIAGLSFVQSGVFRTLAFIAGAFLSAWGLWYLRHSISLEPAARGLVTRGPYAIVRHPLYLAYLLSYSGIVLQRPTVPVVVVFIAWFGMAWARIRYEEHVLTTVFPEYRLYRARVGMLWPTFRRAAEPP